jgi:hypothetical protein
LITRLGLRFLFLAVAFLVLATSFVIPVARSSASGTSNQSGETPLAPICPNVAMTAGLPHLSCFPPDNGNQSQEAGGAGEIAGATLNGPNVLVAGKCAGASYISKVEWCTPDFSLSLSVPTMGSAKYVLPFSLVGTGIGGTGVTTSAAKCSQCSAVEALGNMPGGTLGEGGAWCPTEFKVYPYNCANWTESTAPLLIYGTKGHYSTFQLCVAGALTLVYDDGSKGSFTACIQIQIQYGPTTHTSSPNRKGPLKVTVSYQQNGQPIVLNPKGKKPQKDTIQLADNDTGEIAQVVTMQVKVKNTGKKTQTNVTLNGPPSFSYASSDQSTATLPIGVTGSPTPSLPFGTLAPGQTSKTVSYVVNVTNNGNFVGNVQALSTNPGSNTNLVSQGSAPLTVLPTAYLWLTLSRVSPGLVTAGTQVEISGTVTNRSQTQSIDVDPISPVTTGNAGGGDLVPTAQTPLSDGVILPYAGSLAPGQTMDVEGYVQTAYVPSTRATVTYDPTGSIENADGTETDLKPKQIGLSAGSSEFDIGINTTDPPPPDSSVASVVDNFTDATIKGTSIWALNKLQGGLDILQHPITSATGLAQGVAGFAFGTVQAVGEAASLVSSIYLLGLAADDMSPADRQAWADQIVADFKQSHLKIAANAAASVYAGVNNWVLTLFSDLDSAYTTGNYNTLAAFLGNSTANGLTSAEDLVLSDIAFQKFAIGMKYTGQVATSAVTSAAAIATEQGGLTSLVSLKAAIRDAKATAVLGKSLDGITAGTNLLLDGATALWKSFGLTPRQISELQTYCQRENIIVAVRARSARAAQLIKDGLAVGKNEIIKLKNVNNIDVQFLGYSKHDLNTVIWAEPLTKTEVTTSAAFLAADASTQEIVLARLKIRTKEWHDASIKSILNTSETTGEISWGFNGADNGVAAANKTEYRSFGLRNQANPVKAGGAKRTYQQVLVGNKPGGAGIGRLVPVTQDVDLMAVTSANGEILNADQRLAAYVHLSDIIGIEHPETPTYIKNGEFIFESKVKYLADVTPGGEPLAIFSPTGAVTAGYFDPALTIFDTATHEGRIFFQGAYNDPYSTLKTKIVLLVQGAANI